MKPLLLAFSAGLVSACGFEPWGLWPLTLAAFAGLLWLIDRAPSLRSALARGYWFGAGQFVLGLNWIATAFTFQANMPASLGWLAVVLLALYLAVYPAMAAGLAWRWGLRSSRAQSRGVGKGSSPAPLDFARDERLGLVLILAAAWIVTEWLRATMFTGFAWNPVGVALLPTPAAGLARWIGTYGVSGIAVLLAGIVVLLIDRHWLGAAGIAAAIAIAIVAAVVVQRPAGPLGIPIRVVQPNIGQEEKWTGGFEARNVARLRQLSGIPAPGPRLLLWPEAAITDPIEDERAGLERQFAISDTRQRAAAALGPRDLLLVGGITFRSTDRVRATSATNSIFAIDASGSLRGRYDKAHLVPYGEYLPARPILSRLGLSRLAPGAVDFDSGPGPRTLLLPLAGKVGFQLCYEIIFSGEVVDRADRPGFIFNPSNDAWFGAWGPPQHLAQARLRALEEGLPVIRSTPTGISAVIDADGGLAGSLPWRTAGVIDARLPAARPPTLFARAGNLAPFAFALLLAAIAIAIRREAR